MMIAKYHERTGDDDFIGEIWPHMLLAVKWLLRYGLQENFLRYKKLEKDEGLVSQSWKDGADNLFEKMTIASPIAVVEVQGYFYAALDAAAKLTAYHDEDEIAYELRDKAIRLKKDFDESFWIEKQKFYALAVDGKGKQVQKTASNPGHLLFTGIISKGRAEEVVKRLFREEMWTPYGIRTLSIKEEEFDPYSYQNGSVWPHDNWIIAQGLKSMGFDHEYNRIKGAIIKAYEEIGSAPEYYGVLEDGSLLPNDRLKKKACDPQAWSVGALLDFTRNI